MMSSTIHIIYESARCVGQNELYDIFEDYFDTDIHDVPEFESDEYWQFNEIVNQSEAELFWDGLSDSPLNGSDIHYLITGFVGWYNHRHKFKSQVAHGLEEAISTCIDVCNSDTGVVEFDNGSIIVHTQHHDGANWFEVRRLTPKGAQEATREVAEAVSRRRAVRESSDWFDPIKLDEINF